MHKMQTIASDDPRRLSVMSLRCANTAEWFKVLIGWRLGDPICGPRTSTRVACIAL